MKDINRNLSQAEIEDLFCLYWKHGKQIYLWLGKKDDPEVPVLFSSAFDAERWLLEMAGRGLCDPEHIAAYEPTPVVEIGDVENYRLDGSPAHFWLGEYQANGEFALALKRVVKIPAPGSEQ